MRDIIILYCVFSVVMLASFIATGMEEQHERMKLKHYLSSLFGPFVFPIILGYVSYKIMYSKKV